MNGFRSGSIPEHAQCGRVPRVKSLGRASRMSAESQVRHVGGLVGLRGCPVPPACVKQGCRNGEFTSARSHLG